MILIDVMELLKSTEQVREIMANNCHIALERKSLSSNILYLFFFFVLKCDCKVWKGEMYKIYLNCTFFLVNIIAPLSCF